MIATAFGAILAKSWRVDGALRVYLCGSVAVERGDRLVRDSALAGPQGRLLFVFLMSRSPQPVSKTDLIHALWGSSAPPSADTALNAVISKLRRVLRTVDVDEPDGILSDAGTYRLAMASSWVDVDAARTAADRAEGAARRGISPTPGLTPMSPRRSRDSRFCRMNHVCGCSGNGRCSHASGEG